MDHLLGNGRYSIRDHGNRGNSGAPRPVAPSLALAFSSRHCASRPGFRTTEFTDHRHCASFAPVVLLHRANWFAGRQSSALALIVSDCAAQKPTLTMAATNGLRKGCLRPHADCLAPDEFVVLGNRSFRRHAAFPAAANPPGPGPLPDAERLRMSGRSKASGGSERDTSV